MKNHSAGIYGEKTPLSPSIARRALAFLHFAGALHRLRKFGCALALSFPLFCKLYLTLYILLFLRLDICDFPLVPRIDIAFGLFFHPENEPLITFSTRHSGRTRSGRRPAIQQGISLLFYFLLAALRLFLSKALFLFIAVMSNLLNRFTLMCRQLNHAPL